MASKPQGGCPGREQLAGYLLGNLPQAALDAVADHLEACPLCEALARDLDGAGDGLVAQLRQPVPPSPSTGSTSVSATPWPNRVGQYRLCRPLARGGMGEVFLAEDAQFGQAVAVKLLAAARRGDDAARKRFHREARAASRLNHLHIVRALDAGELADGTPYLVMEYVPGVDLGRLVKVLGPLPVAEACELVRQAAFGLAHAHAHGLVHRDVKPANLLLAWATQKSRPLVKLLDLGLVFDGEATDEGLTGSDAFLGTRDYTAPEQWEDAHAVDARSDLYSLGCTLFHLLVGRPPFAGPECGSVLKKMRAHLHAPPPALADVCPDAPPALGELVQSLLAKRPADRPPGADALAEALAPLAHGADLASLCQERARARGDTLPEVAALTSAGEEVRPARRTRPWRWRLALATVAALLLGVAVWAVTAWLVPDRVRVGETRAVRRTRPVELVSFAGHRCPVSAVALAPTGPLACTGYTDGALWLWDTTEPTRARQLAVNSGPVRAVRFAPDGQTVFTASERAVRQWDTATGQLLRTLEHADAIGALAISGDSRWLAAGTGATEKTDSQTASVSVWDVATGQLRGRYPVGGFVKCLALSADGNTVLAGRMSGPAVAWELNDERRLDLGEDGGRSCVGVAILDGGQTLFTCWGDRIAWWDAATGECRRSLGLASGQSIWQATVSPDGRYLYAGCQEGAFCGWELATGHEIFQVAAHGRHVVRDLDVSPDGGRVLTGGGDGVARVWELPPAENGPTTGTD